MSKRLSVERALCAHCGLPVASLSHGSSASESLPTYCCGGCALAHRLTGGPGGHGEAAGLLMAVGIGAFLAINVMMLSFVLYAGTAEADRSEGESWVRWALLLLATPALFLLGAPLFTRGYHRLRQWRLDTDVLIVLGVLAAFSLSAHSVFRGGGPLYLDTAMGILLFVTIGRYLEATARARTTDALTALTRQMPDQVTRLCEGRGGGEETIPIEKLQVDDRFRVRPGERIAADGRILEGHSDVSEAEITGEPLPASRGPGDTVAAGTLNVDGSLVVRATRTGAATTLARMVHLVDEARAGRYPLASLVDRVAAWFVPAILALSLGTFGYWSFVRGPGEGVLTALSVLLIACPCAIGIAIPLASTAASGRAATAGVLVRSGEVFERLARARSVFFDKTGTLTQARLDLEEIRPAPGVDSDRLLALAAGLELGSEHPIAQATREAADARGIAAVRIEAFRAVPGRGVEGELADEGHEPVRLGSDQFVAGAQEANVSVPGASVVHVSASERWVGCLVFRDQVRPSAVATVAALRERGLRVEVLSGDQAESVAQFAAALEGVEAVGRLAPEEKLARVRAAEAAGERPVMVGDGINDAPALSSASVGVTLETGTDLAREIADVTILGGRLERLPWLLELSSRTMRTAGLNLFWAFFYNVIGLTLAVRGLLHPLFGAAAMVASSLLVVTHSQRLTRHPVPKEHER